VKNDEATTPSNKGGESEIDADRKDDEGNQSRERLIKKCDNVAGMHISVVMVRTYVSNVFGLEV
jgi:hypothetical protein